MKIAVTARLLGGRMEGLGHYTYELLSRLVLSHPDDEWHIIYDQEENRVLLSGDNVFNHFVSPRTRHPWLITYWLERRLPPLLDRIGVDLVWYPEGLVSIKPKIPILQTVHDLAYISYPHGNRSRDLTYYKKYMPRYIDRADHIITISNYTKSMLDHNFPSARTKRTVVYNGYSSNYKVVKNADQAELRKNITSGQPYFLHLGSIHPRKNVETLIKAYEVFRQLNHNYKLVLAGRMAWKSEEVSALIKKSNYKEDIVHLEDIDDIIYDLVGSASALCSLSLVEGFGLPVLEAMACGVSVIVSEDSAMSEVAGQAAFSCNPMSVEEVVSQMETVISNTALVQTKTQQGLVRSQQFDWDKSSQEVYAAMNNIVQEQPK